MQKKGRKSRERAKQSAKTTMKTIATPTVKVKVKAAPPLRYRPREERDNAFICRVTLLTMKRVFEESTHSPLNEEVVMQLVNKCDHVIIIEQGGKPIGYYCYEKLDADRIYWGSLIIVPAKQNVGIGKQVFEHFVADAKRQGVRLIEGHVQIKNEKAYRYWLNKGFQVVGAPVGGSVHIRLPLDERKQ